VLQLSIKLSSGVAFGATIRVDQTAVGGLATGCRRGTVVDGRSTSSTVVGGVGGGGASRGVAVDLRQYWRVDGRRARDAVMVVVVVVSEFAATDDVGDGLPVGDVDVAIEHGTGILLPSFVVSFGDNRGGCKKYKTKSR